MIKRKNLDCILLIDDDDATNFINKVVIDSLAIDSHIEICNSARKGLDYLTCNGAYSNHTEYPQPGIIFLDINMPGMNGWEFLEEYETLPPDQKAHVVVAMLTTSLNPDDAKRGNENTNLSSFMNKPLTKEKILELLDSYFPD